MTSVDQDRFDVRTKLLCLGNGLFDVVLAQVRVVGVVEENGASGSRHRRCRQRHGVGDGIFDKIVVPSLGHSAGSHSYPVGDLAERLLALLKHRAAEEGSAKEAERRERAMQAVQHTDV